MMKVLVRMLQAIVMSLSISMVAFGVPITSYGSLASPDGGTTPGFYNGTGNPNTDFNIFVDGAIEIGLRAKIRGGSTIDGSSGTYIVPLGGGTNPAFALWNLDFSVNYQLPGELGTRTFGNTDSILTIKNNLTGLTNSVNIPQYWPDSPAFGPRGLETVAQADDWATQNSQNFGFGDFPKPGPPAETFNPNNPLWYTVTLSVYDQETRAKLATGSINIMSEGANVPEPGTYALIGAGLVGIAALRRRRSS